jgi:hypothetical protein
MNLEQWLIGRPDIVQSMARRYPPGTKFRIHDKVVWVVSFREDGSLMVSETNPAEDYDKSVATRQPVCNCCVANLDAVRIS